MRSVTAMLAAEGWKDWLGGECPVPHGTRVQVLKRCGDKWTGGAQFQSWGHDGILRGSDIVAYRVVDAKREAAPHDPAQHTLTDASAEWAEAASANAVQVGGDHYKSKHIQPWDYIAANNLGYFEGNVVKYVSRHREKGGVDDLRKAAHYLQKLIELETKA